MSAVKNPLRTSGSSKTSSSSTQKEVECFFCKQKGHISPNCPKKAQRTVNIEPIDEVVSESEDRAEGVPSEDEYVSAMENGEDSGHDNTGDDHQSIEDLCAAARPKEVYTNMGRFLERIEEIPMVDEASLADWSDSRESSDSSCGLGMALHAVPFEDESPHALTASGTLSGDQVAYRHCTTKQTGPLHVESGPK